MAQRGRSFGGRSFGRRPAKINLNLRPDQEIEYKDIELLKKCIGSQGQILSRRRTTLSTQQQRKLKNAIKRARHLALLPFVG
jgi:small subunit ribosomal protein S18